MNPRQRRGAVLTILAAISAIVAFFGITGYVGSVRAEVGQTTEVLMLTRPVAAYEPIDPGALKRVTVPRRWMPKSMIGNPAAVAGKVAAADLAGGSYLQQGMVIPAPALQPGQREIAILIDAETGVGGKIGPGAQVDVLATFQPQGQQVPRACAMRVISGAKVIQVGAPRTQPGTKGETDVNEVVPITFALSTEDSLKLAYAESFASEVRLALVGPGQNEAATGLPPICKAPVAR